MCCILIKWKLVVNKIVLKTLFKTGDMRKEQRQKAQYDTYNFGSTTASQAAEDLNKIA